MAYPSRADYTQAVRDYPQYSILDSKLNGGAAKRGPNNQLESISGGFSIVFPFKVGANTFALRCWVRDIEDVETRYQEISNYLRQRNLPYFVNFEFVPEGILVNGSKWPITRMEWAEGETLCQFIENSLHKVNVLKNMASEFLKMVKTLHAHKISHGDLQDGNILIKPIGTDVDIKLIDYDSLFVPTLRGHLDTIVGLAEYQHPSRIAGGGTANERVDYFSELVIYLSIIALAEKPDLWSQFGQRSEKGLLFAAEDFKNPDQSDIFRELDILSSDVKLLASKLKGFCEKSLIDQLEPLETLLLRSAPSAKAACERGRDFLRSKRYTDALAEFEKAIRIDLRSKEAHHGLGLAYLQMNNLESARRKAKEALRIDANYQPALEVLEAVKRKQNASVSNLAGSGSSPPQTSQPASSIPTHQNLSHERSLRRHYIYRGLAVVCVICVVFALVLKSKNENLRDLKGKLSEIESRFASLDNDNNTLRKKNTGLHNEKRELQGKLSKKDSQLVSLKDENRRLRVNRRPMSQRNHETQKSITGYGESLASLSKKNQELQNANRTLNIQKQEFEKQLTLRDADLNSLTEKYQTMQIENARLRRQNRDLQNLRTHVPQEPQPPKRESEISSTVEILEGHTKWVRSLAFSPDGMTLASASRDNTIRLWNVVANKHQRTLRGHTNWVVSVAFSPDGRTLASGGGSGDKTIRLWNVASGSTEQTLTGHANWVSSVVFSPDGGTLASGSGDNTIRLWNVGTGTHEQTLTGHTNWISSIAFSPDGATLASVSSDKTIRLWNVGTGTHHRILWKHSHYITSVAFSPDGKTLASGSGDGTIRLWDAATRTHNRTLRGHTGRVRSVAFSPDGQTIASGSEDTTIRLWNAITGTHKRTFSEHTDSVFSVAFSPNGKMLASASADKTIRLWR